jgi:hypothetical protein
MFPSFFFRLFFIHKNKYLLWFEHL